MKTFAHRRLCWLLIVLLPAIGVAAGEGEASPLAVRLSGQHFFINNEYFGPHNVGYTLPGFWLEPTVEWQVSDHLQLKGGAHWLHYWGAHHYPAGWTYGVWPAEADSTSSAHVLPVMQAKYSPSESFTLVFGSLDATNHNLPAPLFNGKRLQAADPEAGVELIANNSWWKADVWIDWQEFIWRRSQRQERFLMGCTFAAAWSHGAWEWEVPASFLVQHKGGQALAVRQPVQNRFNASLGLKAKHHIGTHWATRAELHLLRFSSNGRSGLPFDSGWGIYPSVGADYKRVSATIAYWHSTGFDPILGSPLYSNQSVVNPSTYFSQNDLLALQLSFSMPEAEGGTRLQCYATLYKHFDYAEPLYSFGCVLGFAPSLRLPALHP